MNMYIGNLSYNVRESDLRDVMEEFGTVDSVKLIIDRDTRRSKGFAFVEMPEDSEAQNAIRDLNGATYEGRQMVQKGSPEPDIRFVFIPSIILSNSFFPKRFVPNFAKINNNSMTYEETLHYLYTSIPVFQNAGPSAYKPGLGTSIALDDHLGNPHKAYKTIHVAGTNGKGSVSHLLAAILRQSGYKVGLYTSPHLVDFRERIRVNGQKIPEEYVIDFVERHRSFFETLDPSFFELTSSMAFDYFRAEKVDYAVIEVGMGGRLDSTNIITPILSIITNISLDHTQFLGDTVEKIAFEKAGIIKKDVPALVGEIDRHSVAQVFADAAVKAGTLVYFAQDEGLLKESYLMDTGEWYLDSAEYGQLFGELGGVVQFRNATTVLGAINLLNTVGVNIPTEAVREGFEHVVELTGLMGRWQVLQENPKVVCDTGHNVGGWQYLNIQLEEELKRHKLLFMIVGMVNDKDIDGVLDLMPEKAFYFFTQASVQRAMPAEDFATKAIFHGLSGTICNSVQEAVEKALARAGQDDIIFIGGSTFVVADALPLFLKRDK